MSFLHDKRQAVVLALLAPLLGAAALFFGVGAASADHNSHCYNDGTVGDVLVDVPGVARVAVNSGGLTTPGSGNGVWACAIPPDQGGGVGIRDNDPSTLGVQLEASTCGHLACSVLAEDTGAEVDPATSTNQPYDATTGTGGSAATGDETCVYVDGNPTPDCPGGREVAGLTVNEGDAAATFVYDLNGPWLTVGGPGGVGVQLPYGFGVMVGRGTNSSADSVDGTVAGEPVTGDIGGCYVSYNTDSTTCS